MKQTLIGLLLAGLFLSLIFYSCEEDAVASTPVPETSQNLKNLDGDSRTILGKKRTNPFTLDVMRQAWQNLSDPSIPEPQVTDLYIKFTPASMDDLALLDELDEMLYDYPLEYEVLEMGDYYIEPDFENGVFPELYAIVKPGFSYTALPHEVLAELHVSQAEDDLTKEAFRITGNDWEEYVYGDLKSGRPDPTDIDNSDTLDPNEDVGPGLPTSTINECGCRISSNKKRPGGCVLVEDTQHGLQGLRRVKVIMKDTWFTEDETWTDDNGCWRIRETYDTGLFGGSRAWMFVKFKNERTNIRGMRWPRFWEYAFTVKDYAGQLRHSYNDIRVEYWNSPDNGSRQRMYWYAATANNALHEYHDQALLDGISPPANDLDITVFNWNGNAAAPMLDDMWMDDAITYNALNQLLVALGGSVNPLVSVPLNTLLFYINTFSPDISYFYGEEGMRNSDRVKQTFYHEYAHASHFRNVNESWWLDMIIATISNGGWGDENGTDAGRISIAESWAEFIGLTYAHRQYPTADLATVPNFANRTWEEQLERTWNHNPNHVPVGLHSDLLDGRGIEQQSCNRINGTGCTTINDQVEGFTISQIYSSLTDPVTNVQEFEAELISNHLGATPNTTQQVMDLFGQYGQ